MNGPVSNVYCRSSLTMNRLAWRVPITRRRVALHHYCDEEPRGVCGEDREGKRDGVAEGVGLVGLGRGDSDGGV